jgi:glycosyltransferase involved in cell wall biosynthesis
MRIVQITPGSGNNFYCENCVRDAAIAKEWRREGHDALIVPLYLPLPHEDMGSGDVSEIFYGGVNVYLQQKMSLFRRTSRRIDCLFDRPRILNWAARLAGMTNAGDLADTTLSMLRGEEGRQAKELERLVDWLKGIDKPDVILLSNILLSGLARRLKQTLRVPVVCLLQDEDEFIDVLPEPRQSLVWETISQRAADIDMFVPVSEYYANVIQEKLGLQKERIKVVPAGISAEASVPPGPQPKTPTIGYLSRMCREKGLDTLVEAFLTLKHNRKQFGQVKLRIAGGKTANDNSYIREIQDKIKAQGLTSEVEFLTGFDQAFRRVFLQSLTVLSVPERRSPACGLYVLESLAAGVPVVQPPVGVFTELHRAIGDGMILTTSDTADALAAALEPLLLDVNYANQLGEHGRKTVIEKFSIKKTGQSLIEVFDSLLKTKEND